MARPLADEAGAIRAILLDEAAKRMHRALTAMVAVMIPALLVFGTTGCTSMGFDHPALRDSYDYGPRQDVRLCVYLDDGLGQDDALALLDSWNSQAQVYDLYLKPVSFDHMSRAGFTHDQILQQVSQIPLGPSCDRVLYFVNRNLGDFAYGVVSTAIGIPEILGEVDDPTLTHGFVVARRATVNQLVMTPSGVTEHELFHLLGCPEHFNMPDCYARIHNLKLAERQLAARGFFADNGEQPFYPTFASGSMGMLLSRAQVNSYSDSVGMTATAAATGAGVVTANWPR